MAKQTDDIGPWFIEPATEGREVIEWNVSRWNPTPGYDYESMADDAGHLAAFASPEAARDAIAKAERSAS